MNRRRAPRAWLRDRDQRERERARAPRAMDVSLVACSARRARTVAASAHLVLVLCVAPRLGVATAFLRYVCSCARIVPSVAACDPSCPVADQTKRTRNVEVHGNYHSRCRGARQRGSRPSRRVGSTCGGSGGRRGASLVLGGGCKRDGSSAWSVGGTTLGGGWLDGIGGSVGLGGGWLGRIVGLVRLRRARSRAATRSSVALACRC